MTTSDSTAFKWTEVIVRSLGMPLIGLSGFLDYQRTARIGALIIIAAAVPISILSFLHNRKLVFSRVPAPLPERAWYFAGER